MSNPTDPAGLLRAVISVIAASAASSAMAVAIPGQGTWQSSLQGRELDGNAANGFEAYYDTDLKITWLADANYAQTSSASFDGGMPWWDAKPWAAGLTLYGYTGWRLPTIVSSDPTGCPYSCGYAPDPTATSEIAHLYFVTLGNSSHVLAPGQPLPALNNTGPFKNLLDTPAPGEPGGVNYWLNVDNASYSEGAWRFNMSSGSQSSSDKYHGWHVWAVRSGDVTASVPEPSTWALLLAAMALMGSGAVRRK